MYKGQGLAVCRQKMPPGPSQGVPRTRSFSSNAEQTGTRVFQYFHLWRFRSSQALLVCSAQPCSVYTNLACSALASCAFGAWSCGGSPGSAEGAAWEVLFLWDSCSDTHIGKSPSEGHMPSGPWLSPELQHWGVFGGFLVHVFAAWNPGLMSSCLLQTSEREISKEGANNWYLAGFCNLTLSPWFSICIITKTRQSFELFNFKAEPVFSCVGAGFHQPRSVWEMWWNVASHRLCSPLRPAALPL